MKLQVLCGIVPTIKDFLPYKFVQQSDGNGVFSQFWSFEEKVYFVTWI